MKNLPSKSFLPLHEVTMCSFPRELQRSGLAAICTVEVGLPGRKVVWLMFLYVNAFFQQNHLKERRRADIFQWVKWYPMPRTFYRTELCKKSKSHTCSYYEWALPEWNLQGSFNNPQSGIPEQSVTFVVISIRTNIWIYLYQENDKNKYPNIFVSNSYERMSE